MVLKRKNKRRHLIKIDVFGTEHSDDYPHVVLLVTLRCGKPYALDFSSAQHGHYEPIMPWDLYVNTRVELMLEFWKFGEWQSHMRFDPIVDEETFVGGVMWINRKATLVLNAALENWEKGKETLPLNTMLKLSEDAFRQRRSEFIRSIELYLPTQKKMAEWYKYVPEDEEILEMTKAGHESLSKT